MSFNEDSHIRVREAGLDDIDAVTDVLIAAMPGDKEWWEYRFAYRLEHADDHRKYFRVLVEAWLTPPYSQDWAVLVAEVYDEARNAWQTGAYAAWDVSYVNFRKFGVDNYKPHSVAEHLQAHGAATRRDVHPARTAQYSSASHEGRAQYVDAVYGTEQIHLQALGTPPSFTRRGLAGRLVRWGMDRAVRDGVVAALLAAPLARNVYPRLGFVELGTIVVQAEGDELRTFLYPMVWDPEQHASQGQEVV